MIKPTTRINLARLLQNLESETRGEKASLQEVVHIFREQASRFEAMANALPQKQNSNIR